MWIDFNRISDGILLTSIISTQGEGLGWFWLLVLVLKITEQVFEALPQTVIATIYLDKRWHTLSDWQIKKLVSQTLLYDSKL